LDDARGEQLERCTNEALMVVERRRDSCDRYPFDVRDSGLVVAPTKADREVYTFLLLLSKFGPEPSLTITQPEKLFEQLGAAVGCRYLGVPDSRFFEFGFPRKVTPSRFEDALASACQHLLLVPRPKDEWPTSQTKDAGVDGIWWLPFRDNRGGFVWFLGQCASGSDWEHKLSDLAPDAFQSDYVMTRSAVQPIRFFFTPHEVPERRFRSVSTRAGVVFDRLRLAAQARTLPHRLRDDLAAWNEEILDGFLRA
jgi:hypothetical protein